MGSCNSSNRSDSFVKQTTSIKFLSTSKTNNSFNRHSSKKNKLKKTLSFLDYNNKTKTNHQRDQQQQQQQNHYNQTQNSSNEFVFVSNELPKIELDLSNENNYSYLNSYTHFTNLNREIEEYDNAVLDYFDSLNLKDDIIYADDISYPFPTVIQNDHLLTTTSIKPKTFITNTSECSSTSFADLTHQMSHHHYHNKQQVEQSIKIMNISTDNSLNTLSSASQQTNFESSSSSSFMQSTKMQNSKTNRFGFKQTTQTTSIPVTTSKTLVNNNNTNITKSDTLSQKSSSISSSMPNSISSNLPRAKSPFKSNLPRPPVVSTSLKSHPSIPISISNSISLASSTQNNHSNMSRTISTSGVSSNSKHNHSSSLSSLSSTTSSNLSSHQHVVLPLQQQQEKTKNSSKKFLNVSPTKLSTNTNKIQPVHHQLSSSKIQSSSQQQTTVTNTTNSTKRRLFSPYTLNIPTSPNNNTNSTTNQTNNTNNLHTSINSINLNQIYSNDFNNNNISNTTNTNMLKSNQQQQTKLKPPSITTQHFKMINLNASNSKSNNQIKTKMPIKSMSSIKLHEQQQQQTNLNYSNTSPVKQKDLNSATSLIKREDSAYCSSTSSTVSSQETEINKLVINPIKDDNQSNDTPDIIQPLIKSHSQNEETDSEFNNDEEDYTEDNLNTIDNLKQTIINLDLKSSSNMLNLDQISELNFDLNNNQKQQDLNRSSLCSSVAKMKLNRNSIRDSIGELSQLMSTSIVSTNGSPCIEDKSKQRRSSSASLNNSPHICQANQQQQQLSFRPPSNLPPVENSEIIQIDIDSFRLIMQDIQNTKMILYKLASILREPQSLNSSDTQTINNLLGNDEFKPDDLHNLISNNPLITSLYNYQSMCHNYDKCDQATQTE